jgi:hypothetical protein
LSTAESEKQGVVFLGHDVIKCPSYTPADPKPAEPQAKTFKEQVALVFCQTIAKLGGCPDYDGDCTKQFCPKVKEQTDCILSAHNAELDRIAEGITTRQLVERRDEQPDMFDVGAFSQKVADKAYIQAQKGS